MMRGILKQMIFVAILAVSIPPALLAGEKAKQPAAQAEEQAVEQQLEQGLPQEAVPQPVAEPVAHAEPAAAVAGEPPPVGTEPPVEPQEVLKTKTKSNQSND